MTRKSLNQGRNRTTDTRIFQPVYRRNEFNCDYYKGRGLCVTGRPSGGFRTIPEEI
ncbi:MAG: hypothetical protein WD793_11665 [Steroidobacteraceae bacterium]